MAPCIPDSCHIGESNNKLAAAAADEADFKHPLDPLTVDEVAHAVRIVKRKHAASDTFRFQSVALHEPSKATVLNFDKNNSNNNFNQGIGGDDDDDDDDGTSPPPSQSVIIEREAFLILLDNANGMAYEAIVSLTALNDNDNSNDGAAKEEFGKVLSWTERPGVQPSIMADELEQVEALVKAHPDFITAMVEKRKLDLDLIVVDAWAIGNFGLAEEEGLRLSRCICYYRTTPESNFYSRPIDGVIPVVDLNTMQVLSMEDLGVVPVPPEAGEYASEFQETYRNDLKPLSISQPEGPSFTVDGQLIKWQKWQIRVGFTPREGLVLHTVGYEDQGRLRPILYRASMAEMVVPYGDPRHQHFRKNAFDLGEYGIGQLANSLTNGCDCFGEIFYFDAVLTDSRGNVSITENAVCLHEEDCGILWKHTDWRRNHVDVRRSRRLVLSFITTVDNYEYGIYWYFHQDGSIQYEVKLTGILLCGALVNKPKYGTVVAPEVNALNHQHFFGMRLDFNLDGMENSVYEVNTKTEEVGPENPYGNAFYAESTLLETEKHAQRIVNPFSARYWKVVNPNVKNRFGNPVAFKISPGDTTVPFAHPDSCLLKRAGFLNKHLWVTPYNAKEKYPAGDYPNQHAGGEGLPKWTEQDRPIVNTDLVVWYVFGHHHLPRPEDFPVMPCAYSGFHLLPSGFFDQNPALDVPPSKPKIHCHKNN